VPPGYVVVLDDDGGFGVELDDAVASSLDPLALDPSVLDPSVLDRSVLDRSVLDPSVPLFDGLGFEPFDPLPCALLSVR
jgi:hypothetical protein